MNTLGIEATLAKKYGYKPLESELSRRYRQFFKDNIPTHIAFRKTEEAIKTKIGTVIASSFNRVVIGDYGAFIEFTKEQANLERFIIAPGQEYRINDPKYANVKYHWYTVDDGSNVKIYHQQRSVPYADYKPNMYYVSVHEAF